MGSGEEGVVESRVGFIQREQEGFRLALMGDAVSVAASAVYFAVRLVDATFDLHVSSALNGMNAPSGIKGQAQLDAIQHATTKYQTFLEFKHSEELQSMAFSLVFPLLVMRVLGAMKDVLYSFILQGDRNFARKVLDGLDCVVLYILATFSLRTIPPLENELMKLSKAETAWENAKMFETFDELEFCHLVALAQGGLLLLVSLLKLSARLERSSSRIVERAMEFEMMEKLTTQQIQEREKETLAMATAATLAIMEEEGRHRQQDAAPSISNRVTWIDSDQDVVSTGTSTPLGNESPSMSPGKEKPVSEVEEVEPGMDSDEFYKRRGWKRIAVPNTPLPDPTATMAALARMDAYARDEGQSATAADVIMGASMSAATFFIVRYLHDPVAKLLRS